MKHYRLGEFLEAAEEYKAAYKESPSPDLLYNIAQAYRLGHEPEKALFFYRSYLSAVPGSPNRAEVEQRIEKLDAQLAEERRRAAESSKTKPPAAPAPTAQPATPAKSAAAELTAASPQRPARTPVYKKWWLWTTVGVIAAGAAAGIAVGVTMGNRTTGTAFDPVTLP